MKCEKWTDQHDTSMKQRKNLTPKQELNAWPPEHQAGALCPELQELIIEQGHLTDFMCDRHRAYC